MLVVGVVKITKTKEKKRSKHNLFVGNGGCLQMSIAIYSQLKCYITNRTSEKSSDLKLAV